MRDRTTRAGRQVETTARNASDDNETRAQAIERYETAKANADASLDAYRRACDEKAKAAEACRKANR